jgi:hypothetical protein
MQVPYSPHFQGAELLAATAFTSEAGVSCQPVTDSWHGHSAEHKHHNDYASQLNVDVFRTLRAHSNNVAR